MIHHFKQLVKKGNTVIVVEHDLDTISSADHIIEIGPKAGVHGGEVIFNGPFSVFSQKEELKKNSPTYRAIKHPKEIVHSSSKTASDSIRLIGCHERNLKNTNIEFQLGKLNVVSGPSGAGKSSLVKGILLKTVRQQLGIEAGEPAKLIRHENIDAINKLIFIDHSPIGKTPRSNPATYLGLSDHIRDLYASLPNQKRKDSPSLDFHSTTKEADAKTVKGQEKHKLACTFWAMWIWFAAVAKGIDLTKQPFG